MPTVTQNTAESRFDIAIDGEVVGSAYYDLTESAIVFTHTEVDPNREEKGLGSQLVQSALDQVRDDTSLRVVAQCPFVAHWLTKHEDYQDLLRR